MSSSSADDANANRWTMKWITREGVRANHSERQDRRIDFGANPSSIATFVGAFVVCGSSGGSVPVRTPQPDT